MIGEGPWNPVMSGVPSLLGRVGRRGAVIVDGWSARWASSGGACVFGFSSLVSDGRRTPLVTLLFVKFGRRVCIVFGGGLRGGAGRRASCVRSLVLPVSTRTVEAEEEEVVDSRTDGSARSSGVRYLTTGGLLCRGLTCRVRTVLFVDIATPGE